MSKLTELVDNARTDEGRQALQQYLRENDVLMHALKYAAQQAEKVADRVDMVDTTVSDGHFRMAGNLMGQVRKTGDILPEDVIYFSTFGSRSAPQVLIALLDILAAADKAGAAS